MQRANSRDACARQTGRGRRSATEEQQCPNSNQQQRDESQCDRTRRSLTHARPDRHDPCSCSPGEGISAHGAALDQSMPCGGVLDVPQTAGGVAQRGELAGIHKGCGRETGARPPRWVGSLPGYTEPGLERTAWATPSRTLNYDAATGFGPPAPNERLSPTMGAPAAVRRRMRASASSGHKRGGHV